MRQLTLAPTGPNPRAATLVNPICAKRFHRHCSGKPALQRDRHCCLCFAVTRSLPPVLLHPPSPPLPSFLPSLPLPPPAYVFAAKKIDECDMEKFGTLRIRIEKTITILDR